MSEPASSTDVFLPSTESGGAIDKQTGLRPEELAYLKTHLTEQQKAEVVRALGGIWPEEQSGEASTDDVDTGGVGNIAVDDTVSVDTAGPVEASVELDSPPEKISAVESIASHPAVSAGIDYWDEGAAYSMIKSYKTMHLSDQTRDSEALREDFDTLLLLTAEDIQKLLAEQLKGYWAAVCKLENEDGLTYKLVMKSPRAVDMRPDVDMMVSIPAASGLQKELALLDGDPSMMLDLFRAIAGDGRGRHRQGSFKLTELADDVRTPVVLSDEQTAAAVAVLNDKKRTRVLGSDHRVPPLHPPTRPAQTTTNAPPQARSRRRFGRRRP